MSFTFSKLLLNLRGIIEGGRMKTFRILLSVVAFYTHTHGAEVPLSEREAGVLGNRFYLGKREANNYPFSLPEDRVTVNTVYVSNQRGQEVSAEILPLIQEKVSHIVVEDEVDIRPFAALARGGLEKGYGIHFYGSHRLEGLGDILRAWSGDESTAYLHHLDVAIQGMKEGDLRREVVGRVGEALSLPASEKLETLSLRFMHLDPENMGYLYGILRDRPRPFLKRLIFSYNDLTDDLLGTGGALEQIIGERTQFPSLSIMDLRGNSFESVAAWNIGASLFRRRGSLGLLVNGVEDFRGAGVLAGALITPRGVGREAVEEMKRGPVDRIKPQWFLEGHYERPESIYPYRDLGDQMWLATHKRGWKILDLNNRKFETRDIVEILRRVSWKEALKARSVAPALAVGEGPSLETVKLKGTYRADTAFNMEEHKEIVALLEAIPLGRLHLGKNRLGHIAGVYEELSNLTTIKELGFSHNDLGSFSAGDGFGESDRFLMGIAYGFSGLRALNLKGNILTDRDFGQVLRGMEEKKGGFYNLSKNKILLGEGLESLLLGCLRTFAQDALLEEKPFYIDLRNNEIDELMIRGFESTYETYIRENPRLNWPVVRMNPKLAIGGYGKESFMGSVKGFVNIIRARVIREESFFEELSVDKQDKLLHQLFERVALEGISSYPALSKLGQLKRINLGHQLKGERAQNMRALGYFTGLTDLNLAYNPLGEREAADLAVALVNMPGLKSLNLDKTSLTAEGIERLRDVLPALTSLETLNLNNNQLGFEGIRILSSILGRMTSLKQLTLHGTAEGKMLKAGAAQLALALEHLTNLVNLDLASHNITSEGFAALVPAFARLTKLESLEICDNQLQHFGPVLAGILTPLINLEHLNISYNTHLGIEGTRLVAPILERLTRLQSLHVYGVKFGGREGVSVLASALRNLTSLKSFGYNGEALGKEGAEALVPAFQNFTNLESFYLGYSSLGHEGVRAIAPVLRTYKHLQTLHVLGDYHLGAEGAEALAPVFPYLGGLKDLLVHDNGFGAEGAAIMGRYLGSLTNLRYLSMGNNSLGTEGMRHLASALETITTLRSLSLVDNNIGDQGVEALVPVLRSLTNIGNLQLQGNTLTRGSVPYLGAGLSSSSSREHLALYLSKNNFGEEGARNLTPILAPLSFIGQLHFREMNLGDEGIRALIPSFQRLFNLRFIDLTNNSVSPAVQEEIRLALRGRYPLTISF